MQSGRTATATLGVTMLVAITAYCPSWVCEPPAAATGPHSCCHHPRRKHSPCDTTSQTCPYLLLEKSKAIALHLPPPTLQALPLEAPPLEYADRVRLSDEYFPDTTRLYLRNRVLLI